jgi:DNA repair photolyase
MSLIYQPKGKAREYSPLALNIYSGGCDHRCKYCYCSSMQKSFGKTWGDIPIPRNLSLLDCEAEKASRQILLCFVGDPYCIAETKHRKTRQALATLKKHKCSVAILTKGGKRCLDDLNTFQDWPDGRVEVGATLTFMNPEKSIDLESGAALPAERLDALRCLNQHGIKTFASIEPVIDPAESLAVIRESLFCVDTYKVGKLNHQESSINWRSFCVDAVNLIRSAGRKLYVKDDLRPFAPSGFLRPEECSPETVFLSDKPKEKTML